MKITLKQLNAFAGIVKYNSVSIAAQHLHISQSALSIALAELESQLKGKLFQRLGKKLILNTYGSMLLPKAMAVLNQTQQIEALFSNQASMHSLNIGASATISNYLLADKIEAYLVKYPNMRFSLSIDALEPLLEGLNHFKFDIVFSERFAYHPNLQTIDWYQDSLAIFSSDNHPLTKKKQISREDLQAAPWILSGKGSGLADFFETNIAPKLKQVNVRMMIAHNDVILQMVASGLGIGCLSTLILQKERDKFQKLHPLATPFLDLTRKFYVFIRKDEPNLSVHDFLDCHRDMDKLC